MTNTFCSWREEEIADLLMDKLTEEKRVQLNRHLLVCERCSALYREWSDVLSPAETLPSPSPTLKRRLMKRVAFDRWTATFIDRLRTASLATKAGLLALCLVGLFALQRDSVIPSAPPVAADLPDVAMVMDPQTVLHVVPSAPGDAKFYVWVNDASNEMLILTKGLTPSAEIDYQVWLVTRGRRSHVGLLHWQNGMAHLYFQGGELGQAENVAVSIEPKGPVFRPTGPDAIFVNLR
jgi:hypothetical protein